MKIDGKQIANRILEELKKYPKPKQFFGAVLVSENPQSLSFLKQKQTVAKELGVDFRIYTFPKTITQDKLRKEVLKITEHKTCGGAIVQLPLPDSIQKQYVLNAIPREKDIDVLGERALGAFYTERNPVMPPAVGVVKKIIEETELKIENLKIAVVGLGSLVGRPISSWLKGKCSELYLLDIGSDLEVLKEADLVILGTGQAGLIAPDMINPSAGVIDFGYGEKNGKIGGDFDMQLPEEKYKSLSFYTPTPGGTGPILVAQLFENFYTLTQNKKQ